jgi:hypothetical protein
LDVSKSLTLAKAASWVVPQSRSMRWPDLRRSYSGAAASAKYGTYSRK